MQSGIHYESAPGRCGRRVACYAAVDFSPMQERNWRMDINAEGGLAVQGLGRTTRIFLEWHDGRPTVNEFFKDTISTLSLGIKVDL